MAQRPRYKQIGRRIRQAREDLGWSQRELAEKASISQTAVHHYEQGSRRIGVADLERLAALLGRSLDFFLARSEAAALEPPSSSERRMADVLGLGYIPVVPAAALPARGHASGVRDAAVSWLALPQEIIQGADAVLRVEGGNVTEADTIRAYDQGLGAGDLVLLRFETPTSDASRPVLVPRQGGLQLVPASQAGRDGVALVVGVVRRFDDYQRS